MGRATHDLYYVAFVGTHKTFQLVNIQICNRVLDGIHDHNMSPQRLMNFSLICSVAF